MQCLFPHLWHGAESNAHRMACCTQKVGSKRWLSLPLGAGEGPGDCGWRKEGSGRSRTRAQHFMPMIPSWGPPGCRERRKSWSPPSWPAQSAAKKGHLTLANLTRRFSLEDYALVPFAIFAMILSEQLCRDGAAMRKLEFRMGKRLT